MRSEEWFADDMRWTFEISLLADDILQQWLPHPDLEGDAFLAHLLAPFEDDVAAMQEIDVVWKKTQACPHCFELAAVRGELDTLDMQGKTRDATTLTVAKTRFSFCGWKVDSADIHDYTAEGELTESLLQGLYILLRDRFPQTAYVFPPHLIRTSNVSRTLAQPRHRHKATPEPFPNIALFPYRTTKSWHWVLYALMQSDTAPREERLLLFKRSNVFKQ